MTNLKDLLDKSEYERATHEMPIGFALKLFRPHLLRLLVKDYGLNNKEAKDLLDSHNQKPDKRVTDMINQLKQDKLLNRGL